MIYPKPVVLVVEDDPLILIHSRLALEDAGFDVVAAADSNEALRVLGARADITTLFTDVNIPGPIDGIALARTVHQRRRDIAIFVTSGMRTLDPDAIPEGARFLPKPYTGAQVSRLLRAAADA